MTDCLKNKSKKLLMNIFFVLVAFSPLSTYAQSENCNCKELMNGQKIDLSIFSDMMDSYYQYHFEYPDNMKSLIDFEEQCMQVYPDPEPWNSIALSCNLPYLKRNQSSIEVIKSDTAVIVRQNDSILFKTTFAFGPCDWLALMEENPIEYIGVYRKYSSPRYFDAAGSAIIDTHLLDSIFTEKKLFYQKKCLKEGKFILPTYGSVSQTIPVFTFFDYPIDSGIRYFCNKEAIFNSQLLFFKEFSSFLKEFCLLYNVDRIIFSCPEYTEK